MIVSERLGLEDFGLLEDRRSLDLLYFGELGFSLKKVLKKIVRAPRKISKKLGIKKFFLKNAPFIALSANALNLVVPGLGSAISVAITAGHTALAAKEQKQALKKAKKLERAEEAALEKEEREANAQAEKSLMAAYVRGEKFFAQRYEMSRGEFQALSLDEKLRFFNVVTYDANFEKFAARGISREAFASKSNEEQTALIAEVGGALRIPTEAAPEAAVVEAPAIVGPDLTAILVGGAVLVAIPLALFLLRPGGKS